MRRHVYRAAGWGLGLLSLLSWPLSCAATPALALEMGCYNCHGAPVRGDAPSFERLAAHYAPRRGNAAAEQHVVEELLRTKTLQHITPHERLSPETARQLVHWLFDGAP